MVIVAQCTATFQDLLCFPAYYFPASPILWQTVEVGPLGHVRVVEALQNFVQKCDPVELSGIRIHIAGV